MKMNKFGIIGAVSAAIFIGSIVQSGAVTNTNQVNGSVTNNVGGGGSTNAVTTNLMQNLNFALTFYEQGPTNAHGSSTTITANKIKVTTKDIVHALGLAMGTNFSSGAQLVFVENIFFGTGLVEVKDGNHFFDVTPFFATTNSPFSVISGTINTNGTVNGTTYSILRVVFANDAADVLNSGSFNVSNNPTVLAFHLQGFTTTQHSTTKLFKTFNIRVDQVNAQLSGLGIGADGQPAVVQGTMTVSGHSFIAQ